MGESAHRLRPGADKRELVREDIRLWKELDKYVRPHAAGFAIIGHAARPAPEHVGTSVDVCR
jgi:hypothetical protein